MVDVQMLIIMYLIFMIYYDICCTCAMLQRILQSHWSLQNTNKEMWSQIPELRCVTMIDPVTGWFKIKQYDDKKSITVSNIIEQEWLARYPRPYLITLD